MIERQTVLAPSESPFEILGVAEEADDELIRAAYLRRVKESPPDRSPEEFERIRDAYEALKDPRRRSQVMLLSADPDAPLASLLEGQNAQRRFVGPKPWLEALRERQT